MNFNKVQNYPLKVFYWIYHCRLFVSSNEMHPAHIEKYYTISVMRHVVLFVSEVLQHYCNDYNNVSIILFEYLKDAQQVVFISS